MAQPDTPLSVASQASVDVEQELRWEGVWRRRATIAAAIGGVVPLFVQLILARLVLPNAPKGDAAGLLFVHRHAGAVLVIALITALATPIATVALAVLYRATHFRRPTTPRIALILLLVGAVLVPLMSILTIVHDISQANHFATLATHTDAEARHLTKLAGFSVFAIVAYDVSALAWGIGVLLIALQAMRAGLISVPLGYVGVGAGVLSVAFALLLWFWLIALAIALSGWTRNGLPKAWQTGAAEPWPTQQALREARQARAGELRRNRDGDEPSDAPELGPGTGQPRRRRKRR